MRQTGAVYALIFALFLAPAFWSCNAVGGDGDSGGKQGVMEGMKGMRRPAVEYSADKYTETEKTTVREKVYIAPDRERSEMETGGMKMISITRFDKKVKWQLMPDQMMYMESAIGEPAAPAGPGEKAPDESKFKIEYTVVGEEVIDGINTAKSKMIATDPDGGKFGGFMWTTKEGIQIKMDAIAKDGSGKARFKTELNNLRIGRLDPSLFEIPEGYRKMSRGGFPGLFGGMDMGETGSPARNEGDKTPSNGAPKKDGDTDTPGMLNKMKNLLW